MATFDHGRSPTRSWLGGDVAGTRLRWSGEALQISTVVVDVASIFVTLYAAVGIHLGFPMPDHMRSLGVTAAALFVTLMVITGGYRVVHLNHARRQVMRVAQAWGLTFFILAWIAFLIKVTDVFSRGAVSLWFAIGGLTLVTSHAICAKILARAYARGTLSHRRVAVIAVAEESGVRRICERLAHEGIEIAGFTALTPAEEIEAGEGAVRGEARAAEDVRRALARSRLDGVWIFASWQERRRVSELKAALAALPLAVHLFADHETEQMLARPMIRVGDLVALEIERAPLSRFDRACKRALDVTVASLALILLSPLMALTAIAIVVESGRPVLFRQHRKGFGARPFGILKFRSMTVRENGDTVVQASRDDVRVTRIGRMIRRTSIDELPQLVNVLKGDMSIVGPRPHAIAHDDYYDGLIASYALRQHVKPGITGWAQVRGLRGETREVEKMRARVEHDLWYIDNWSIWLDLRIILMTAFQVVFDDNAY
ncbi:MAG: undecaprenyl-phosphate glucose phosphotransferase [Phyllobacteriaceae bacterium]|nr:undecaprenyl-phosphate glucose phosphotransferase [Phyllobacteriaceae bacterium]